MVAALGRPAEPEYYLDSQQTLHGPRHGAEGRREAAGAWWNPHGMLDLPDGGPVEAGPYGNLYRGFSPDGLTGLLQPFGRRRRRGTDIVFPADKSVSALWALADPATGRQIERAHDDAVRVALLEIVSKQASWVVGRRAGARELLAARTMGATFRHGASRAGDPHLHSHCVIFNLGFSDDGVCRSLEQQALRCWMRAAGPVYRHALAWNLRERLGIRCEQYGRNGAHTRVPGIPFGLVREWSKRNRDMEAAMEGTGMRMRSASPVQADMFSRATRERPADPHPELESLVPAWSRERDAHVADPARLIASLSGPGQSRVRLGEIGSRLKRLPEDLAAGRFVFSYPSVVEAVCNVTAGHMDWRSAESWVVDIVDRADVARVDDPERSPAARAGRRDLRLYALKEEPGLKDDLKQAVQELTADGRFHVSPPAVEDRIGALVADGYPLASADAAAIRHCTSSSRVAVVEFAPAMDRSLVLRPVADLYREQGYQVIGMASTLRAAAELDNESGIAAMQAERLLRMSRKGALDEDRALVLAVADAGTLSARNLMTLVEFAKRRLAKILLIATSGQRPTLATTPGLDLVAAVAGRRRVGAWAPGRSEEGRMRPETAGEAREALPRIAISESVAGAERRAPALSGRVRFCAGLEDAFERVAGEWVRAKRSGPGDAVAVVVRTLNEEKALNHVIRARLFAGSADGPRVRLQVHRRSGQREYGVAAPIEIRKGDWLRLGVTLWEKRLFRGSVVAVEDIVSASSASGTPRYLLRVRTGAGRREEFFHDEVRDRRGGIRLGHGYVSMAADLFGRFDRLLVLADDRWRTEQLERLASCCRGEIDIHVNRELLAAAMRPVDGWGGRRAAVDESRMLDHFRRRWPPLDGSTQPGRTLRPEVARLYPDGHRSASAWIIANDDGEGSLRRLAGDITCSELDLRHGKTVAAFAGGRREVLAEWARWQERVSADGDSALLSEPVGDTIRRHRELLDLARSLPRPQSVGAARFLAERGSLTQADIREFRDLYRRMRTDRWIAAMRAGRRKSARGDADLRTDASRKGRRTGQHAELVETYLAEVGRCREFRSFARDVATRQDRPLDGLASWAQSLADYERMIARGREMLAGQLAATGSSQADGTGMAAIRTAVETLEEEWRRDLFGPDHRSDGADVRQRKRSPRAEAEEAAGLQQRQVGQGQSMSM